MSFYGHPWPDQWSVTMSGPWKHEKSIKIMSFWSDLDDIWSKMSPFGHIWVIFSSKYTKIEWFWTDFRSKIMSFDNIWVIFEWIWSDFGPKSCHLDRFFVFWDRFMVSEHPLSLGSQAYSVFSEGLQEHQISRKSDFWWFLCFWSKYHVQMVSF